MRRRLVSALLVATAPLVLASSGCSSADVAPSREPIAQHRQRLGGSTKNCQLIGDWDRSTYPPTLLKVRTYSSYGVEGSDLGYPVSDGSRLWFFFGDMFASNPPNSKIHESPDPLGFTTDLTLPADGCPSLEFPLSSGPFTFKPQTLDGKILGGFEVPTGAVFDADNQRFIAGFMKATGGGVFFNVGVLGTATAASPTEFTPLLSVLTRLEFLLVAPVIVPASEVDNSAQLGVSSPTDKVLLLWGTKQPYRNSAVYLAAAPLASIEDVAAWKVLDGTSTWIDPLAGSAAPVYPPEKVYVDPSDPDAPYLQGVGCVGEFSVNFNPVFRKWMMLYVCGSNAGTFSQGRGTRNGAVYLRTAEKPLGPWSPALPIFRPKLFGVPTDGDPASFVHVRNPRIYRDATGWHPLAYPYDSEGTQGEWEPPPPPAPSTPVETACPATIPQDCPSAWPQDPDDPTLGCCTDANQCCDGLFEKHVGLKGIGSYGWAGIYASYLVQEYSQALDGSGTAPPTHQRIHYVLSTAQPYTVVLMSSELHDDDIDNDGVLNDTDNCPNVYNPKQENCNADAESDQGLPVFGDACDPVPCPAAKADRLIDTKYKGTCTRDLWEASVCYGRKVRDRIDVAPVGASPLEEIQQLTGFKSAINLPVADVRTDVRFCQHKPPTYDCRDATKRRDQEMWRFATVDEESSNALYRWHRVTLDDLPRGESTTITYGIDRRTLRWNYLRDSAYWEGTPTDEPPNPNGRVIPETDPAAACKDTSFFGSGTCLDGMLWTHGFWDAQDVPGMHRNWVWVPGYQVSVVGIHGLELSNAFFPASPDHTFAWAYGGVRAKPLFWLVFTRPDPPPSWRFFDGSRVPIVFDNREPEAAFDDGHRALASEVFTAEALSALQTSGMIWVAPAEASPSAGTPSRPIGIGVRNRGSGMEARGTLVWSGAQVDVGPGVSATSSGPRPRTNYLTSYSRSRARLFVGGGTDAATGHVANDVWMLDVTSGVWKQLSPDIPLLELQSMTYSYRERVLWVLDRGDVAGDILTRLIRIEPETGTTQILREARQRSTAPRYPDRYLSTDADGRVVLSVSSSLPQRHEIALLEARPGMYAVTGTGCRARALAAGAVADLRGYALYYQPQTEIDASCDPSVPAGAPAERLAELPLQAGTLTMIRGMLE